MYHDEFSANKFIASGKMKNCTYLALKVLA